MANKKDGLDVGLIFGPPPKGGGSMGPDHVQLMLGHKIFDTAVPMKERVLALHDYVHACIDETSGGEEEEEEAPASEKSEGPFGGY